MVFGRYLILRKLLQSRLNDPDGKKRCVNFYRQAQRVLRYGGEMPQELQQYAEKARFSQHDISQEELQLRQYFSEMQFVPQEWYAYKALFAWEERESATIRQKLAHRHSHRRPAIAASLAALLLVGAGILLLNKQDTPTNYAVIDGHITTDLSVVKQEAEQALMMVTTTEEETFDALNTIQL